MSFLKETVRSMRAYLLLAGFLGGFGDIVLLGESSDDGVVVAFAAVGLVVSIAFIYCGLRLRSLLANNAKVVRYTLIAALATGVILGGVLVATEVEESGPWINVVIAVAIPLYLLAQVKRLAAEVQGKSIAEIFD